MTGEKFIFEVAKRMFNPEDINDAPDVYESIQLLFYKYRPGFVKEVERSLETPEELDY